MVLDESSSDASRSEAWATTTNTNSGASLSNSPFAKYSPVLQIRPETITPCDLITRTLCFYGKANWQRHVEQAVAQRVENTRTLLKRLPTQDELDAMVTHSSYSLNYERKGIWWGAGVYAICFWRKMTQGERFRTYVGKTPQLSLELLRGPLMDFVRSEPMAARQVLMMASFKLMFSMIAGATVSSTWGVFRETKDTIDDPRLSQFIAEMRKVNPGEMQKRKHEAAREAADSRRRQIQQRHLGGEAAEQQYGGDSPVNPEVDSAQMSVDSVSSAGRGAYSESMGRAPEGSGAVPAAESQPQGRGFFDDDDASPVAAEYKDTGVGSVEVLPQGSAWERIRRRNISGASQKSSEGSAPPPPADSAWGNPDGDRQREREQAQAEFDRMLESERSKGGDPSASKGWAKWE